jgi:hypothetical protein
VKKKEMGRYEFGRFGEEEEDGKVGICKIW